MQSFYNIKTTKCLIQMYILHYIIFSIFLFFQLKSCFFLFLTSIICVLFLFGQYLCQRTLFCLKTNSEENFIGFTVKEARNTIPPPPLSNFGILFQIQIIFLDIFKIYPAGWRTRFNEQFVFPLCQITA